MTFAATLHAALSLAQAGEVTSLALGNARSLSLSCAATYLDRYARLGYLIRVSAGTPWHPATYAITPVGCSRLRQLSARIEVKRANPFSPLIEAMSSPFAMGATGSA
jgi:hypothetical protein